MYVSGNINLASSETKYREILWVKYIQVYTGLNKISCTLCSKNRKYAIGCILVFIPVFPYLSSYTITYEDGTRACYLSAIVSSLNDSYLKPIAHSE